MLLDVFNNDIFNVVSLTTAINKLPYIPSRLSALGLFKVRGITTTTAIIETKSGRLMIVPTAARGTMPNVYALNPREARPFIVPYIPLNAAVYAKDVEGVRAFGSETELETVAGLINDKMQGMQQSLEITREYHRIGALRGEILDADGTTVIYNLFDEFDLTQEEVTFDFADDGSNVKQLALNVIRFIGDALGGTPYREVYALCGDQFYDNLTNNDQVKAAMTTANENAFLGTQQARTVPGFRVFDITWENYRGRVGTVDFIPTDECIFFPVGAPDLFEEVYAPADFMETVNTVGKPVYAKQERMKFDIGVELHTQTNPLMMCNRPSVLVKGIDETSSA